MDDSAVQDVLERIQHLSDDDRLYVTRRLAEITDEQWKQEAEKARRIAKERGIDQAAIDRAVDEIRHRP
jgi:hypothetical protein